mmetsp:Transcript_17173/g.16497  ORF Transcript_17173/g.16497 Transcript_17173/m.16497 type:complete len:88 (+) Transcript_17173:163-426(+)
MRLSGSLSISLYIYLYVVIRNKMNRSTFSNKKAAIAVSNISKSQALVSLQLQHYRLVFQFWSLDPLVRRALPAHPIHQFQPLLGGHV